MKTPLKIDTFTQASCMLIFFIDFMFSAEKVSALSKWLKEIPTASMERQSCGAEILDEEVVKQLQEVMKVFAENPPESKKLKLQVKPHVLYRVSLCFS